MRTALSVLVLAAAAVAALAAPERTPRAVAFVPSALADGTASAAGAAAPLHQWAGELLGGASGLADCDGCAAGSRVARTRTLARPQATLLVESSDLHLAALEAAVAGASSTRFSVSSTPLTLSPRLAGPVVQCDRVAAASALLGDERRTVRLDRACASATEAGACGLTTWLYGWDASEGLALARAPCEANTVGTTAGAESLGWFACTAEGAAALSAVEGVRVASVTSDADAESATSCPFSFKVGSVDGVQGWNVAGEAASPALLRVLSEAAWLAAASARVTEASESPLLLHASFAAAVEQLLGAALPATEQSLGTSVVERVVAAAVARLERVFGARVVVGLVGHTLLTRQAALGAQARAASQVLFERSPAAAARSLADSAAPATAVGNATQYTSEEIGRYQIALWVSVVLALIVLATICVVGTIDSRDPVLYSKFRRDDAHVHGD